MVRIGITGGIACGKSEVSKIIESVGCSVLDTDDVVRELQRKEGAGYRAVVDWMGESVLCADGELNRPLLAERVFGDKEALMRLNGLIHPLVKARCEEWLKGGGDRVLVVPLLFEVNWELGLDATVCVCAPELMQLANLMGRGLDADAARQRIAAQMPLSEKARRADFLIVNDGTLRDLREKTLETWKKMMEMIHGR